LSPQSQNSELGKLKLILTHQSLWQHQVHVILLLSPHLESFLPKDPMCKANLVDEKQL
jgi:hypothetical protein